MFHRQNCWIELQYTRTINLAKIICKHINEINKPPQLLLAEKEKKAESDVDTSGMGGRLLR